MDRLRLLYVTLFPAGPPRYGAQRRLQGLMQGLGARHELTALSLISPELDRAEAGRAMGGYCSEVVLVDSPPWDGLGRRLRQARSLFSRSSFERRSCTLPALRRALDAALSARRYDLVNIEAPFLAHYPLARAPRGLPPPRLVLDQHNLEFDLARQMAGQRQGLLRRLHNTANWPKIRSEELAAWRRFDGVTFTSAQDEARARELVPQVRSAVVPNAVDLQAFAPRAGDPPSDGRTVLFFGAINYHPNLDGVLFFLREAWPRLAAAHPQARLKIIGQHPTAAVLAHRGPRVEVTGLVDDLRAHLAAAAVVIVPLRLGGGTRLKILEAMAMAKPIVSTRIGAEGIEATPGRHLLLEDAPADFAAAVGRLLDDPRACAALGAEARALAEARYSWESAALRLEAFFGQVLAAPPRDAIAL